MRAAATWWLLPLATAAGAALILGPCGGPTTAPSDPGPFVDAIVERLDRGATTIPLQHLPLEGSRAFLFGPYTEKETVEARIGGTGWEESDAIGMGASEGACLLVLTDQAGELLSWSDLPRMLVDLCPGGTEEGAGGPDGVIADGVQVARAELRLVRELKDGRRVLALHPDGEAKP